MRTSISTDEKKANAEKAEIQKKLFIQTEQSGWRNALRSDFSFSFPLKKTCGIPRAWFVFNKHMQGPIIICLCLARIALLPHRLNFWTQGMFTNQCTADHKSAPVALLLGSANEDTGLQLTWL